MQPAQTTQPQKHDWVSLLSIVILLVLTWGFYRTYIVFFPSFEGFQFAQHFHGGIMLLWMVILIVQPLLIARNKFTLHRAIGKATFVVAPILMTSIFLVSRMTYHNNLKVLPTPQDAIAIISLSLPGIFIFGILYGLAIANKRRTYYHMRYMIGTALLMIGPGLGRILGVNFQVPMNMGVSITLAVISLIASVFLIVDLAKKRDYIPNLIVSGLMIIYLVAWEIRYTALWQSIGNGFAKAFF
jgi:hypothetical protein